MVDYHPFSDAIFDDPYPIYKRLRDESPLHYLEEFDCWFVSRFEDVWALEQDQSNLTSKFGTTSTHLVTKQTPTSPNLSGLDPPAHGPVRSYFNPPFKPGAVASLEPRVRAFAREALDAVRERGRDVPGDVAVMGFDNWEVMTTDARPPLTSVDMNLEEMGRAAARALFAALDGSPRSGLEALPCRIVIRGSTAPLG